MKSSVALLAVVMGVAVAVLPVGAATEPADDEPKFSAEQIEQLVAPIALYPDALLLQVLVASTYPLEVVEADRWCRAHGDLKGDALEKAVAAEDWDPSIQGLTEFPDLLKRMSENLDWTKDLGDAFLDQRDGVMDAVQAMRRRAADAGTLKTSEQQTVTREVVNEKETIIIQPAQPDTVYVPQYAPQQVYGPTYAPPTTYYPAMWGYPPGYVATTSLLSFGAGVATGALIAGAFDWGRHDVYVHNYYGGGGGGGRHHNNVNVNVNRNNVIKGGNKWQHDGRHRRNVDYRRKDVGRRYEGNRRSDGRKRDRDASRGFDRDRGPNAGRPGDRRPGDGNRPGNQRPGRDRPEQARPGGDRGGRDRGRDRDRVADSRPRDRSGGKQTSFSGAGGDRANAGGASRRGAASRGTKSLSGGGGGRQGGGGRSAGAGGGGGGRGGGGGHGGGGGRGGGGRRR